MNHTKSEENKHHVKLIEHLFEETKATKVSGVKIKPGRTFKNERRERWFCLDENIIDWIFLVVLKCS